MEKNDKKEKIEKAIKKETEYIIRELEDMKTKKQAASDKIFNDNLKLLEKAIDEQIYEGKKDIYFKPQTEKIQWDMKWGEPAPIMLTRIKTYLRDLGFDVGSSDSSIHDYTIVIHLK